MNNQLMESLVTCTRCLGKGFVDKIDIERLNRKDFWIEGTCAFCSGNGKITLEFAAKNNPDSLDYYIDDSENFNEDFTEASIIKKLDKKNLLIGVLTNQEKYIFNKISKKKLNGFPKMYYGFISLLKSIFLGLDPLRLFLTLNTIGLVIGIASGEFLIIGFWFSNIIFIGITSYMDLSIMKQLDIETEFEDINDVEFLPINNSYWKDIITTKVLFSNDNFIFFKKDNVLPKMFFKNDLLDYPIFDLSSLRNIYIFSGLYLKDNIIPKKRINFSNKILKKIEENDISSRIIIVLDPEKSNGYPIIISFKDFDSSYEFLKRIIQKTNQTDNISREEKFFEIYEEERWLKKNIKDRGVHIILPDDMCLGLPDYDMTGAFF